MSHNFVTVQLSAQAEMAVATSRRGYVRELPEEQRGFAKGDFAAINKAVKDLGTDKMYVSVDFSYPNDSEWTIWFELTKAPGNVGLWSVTDWLNDEMEGDRYETLCLLQDVFA